MMKTKASNKLWCKTSHHNKMKKRRSILTWKIQMTLKSSSPNLRSFMIKMKTSVVALERKHSNWIPFKSIK